MDVFTILRDGDIAYVNFLMVRNGTIVQTHTLQLNPQLDEPDAEVLSFGIAQIRAAFNSDAPEIVVPVDLDYAEPGVAVTVSKGGDKKKLLELSEKNVRIFMDEIRRKRMLHIEDKTDRRTF